MKEPVITVKVEINIEGYGTANAENSVLRDLVFVANNPGEVLMFFGESVVEAAARVALRNMGMQWRCK